MITKQNLFKDNQKHFEGLLESERCSFELVNKLVCIPIVDELVHMSPQKVLCNIRTFHPYNISCLFRANLVKVTQLLDHLTVNPTDPPFDDQSLNINGIVDRIAQKRKIIIWVTPQFI